METRFFSSDYHIGYKRMVKIRGFSSVEEHDDTIITNHNSVVKKNDPVYYLGDFVKRKDNETVADLLNKLNGRFWFISGNHDKQIPILKNKIVKYVKNGYLDIKVDGQKVTLSHYPQVSWNCSHYGAWMLHGHHHSKKVEYFTRQIGKVLNVNIEFHNFYPWSWNQIVEYMDTQLDNWDLIKKDSK